MVNLNVAVQIYHNSYPFSFPNLLTAILDIPYDKIQLDRMFCTHFYPSLLDKYIL